MTHGFSYVIETNFVGIHMKVVVSRTSGSRHDEAEPAAIQWHGDLPYYCCFTSLITHTILRMDQLTELNRFGLLGSCGRVKLASDCDALLALNLLVLGFFLVPLSLDFGPSYRESRNVVVLGSLSIADHTQTHEPVVQWTRLPGLVGQPDIPI